MLNLSDITNAVYTVAEEYDIKRVSLFGSYAEGRNTPKSDVDLLVEFVVPAVSLFTIIGIKNRLEEILGVSVDVIHAPLPDNSLINPEKVVEIYAA